MNILNSYIDTKTSNNVSGQWSVARWTPDIATGETLNIGVMFLGSNGDTSFRMLNDYERLSCLFDSKSAEFHAELACKVATEFFSGTPEFAGNVSPNLQIECRGFAQGTSSEEIVERLYSSVVTLGKPCQKKVRKERFSSIALDSAYNSIKLNLKKSLDLNYESHVPKNPYHEISDSFGKEKIYLPFTRNRNQSSASLATAAYADPWRVKSYLYEGFRNVETALKKSIIEDGALFIVLPGGGLAKKDEEQINDELSTFYSFTKRHGIDIYSHVDIPTLSGSINEWCSLNVA